MQESLRNQVILSIDLCFFCFFARKTPCSRSIYILLFVLGFTRHIVVSFQSDSSVTITCANGKWTKQVSCEPVDCGLPDKYHVHPAQFIFPEGTTYGKRSTFHCREPAQLVGESQRACTLQRTSHHGDDLAVRELILAEYWLSHYPCLPIFIFFSSFSPPPISSFCSVDGQSTPSILFFALLFPPCRNQQHPDLHGGRSVVLPRGSLRAALPGSAPGAQRRASDQALQRDRPQGGDALQVQVQAGLPRHQQA